VQQFTKNAELKKQQSTLINSQ